MRWFLLTLVLVALPVHSEPLLPEIKLPPGARELPLDEVQKLLAEHPDSGLLDVRMAEEGAHLGRIPGSKHLDFFRGEFAAELVKLGLDPAKPCVVYCALGARAKRAAVILSQLGFKDIILPAGGFNAWKKAGKPVEGGERPESAK
jgi:rhodanese-related sulfurtransferase